MVRAATACALLAMVTSACGPRASKGGAQGARSSADGDDKPVGTSETTTEVVKNGNVTTVITKTTKWVPAPDPPDRPADPWPADPLVKYNVDRINDYRAKAGLPPLKFDASVSAFALQGSKQLAVDHTPHAHFAASAKGATELGSRSEENQGDWDGVPEMDPQPLKNGQMQIDVMLKLMMDEGPGGGHYENILSDKMKRVGVGLFYAGGKLYLTNDFSN